MSDKVVVLTGANGDIGRQITKTLLAENYVVAACVRSKQSINTENSSNLSVFECDFSSPESIQKCTSSLKTEFKNIFGIVNCVGVAHGSTLMMTKNEDFERVFQVNYFGIVQFIQALSRKLIKRRQGSIVNLASTAGILVDPGTLVYGSSKAALIHATKIIANELGNFGIRVNAIAPAVVESKMALDMDSKAIDSLNQRAAVSCAITPEHVASMVSYLLSDASVSVTGQVLRIDRGIT